MTLFRSEVETVLREQLDIERARNATLWEKYHALVDKMAAMKLAGAVEVKPARVIGQARRALQRAPVEDGEDNPDEERPGFIEAENRRQVEAKLIADLQRDGASLGEAQEEARRIRQAALTGEGET